MRAAGLKFTFANRNPEGDLFAFGVLDFVQGLVDTVRCPGSFAGFSCSEVAADFAQEALGGFLDFSQACFIGHFLAGEEPESSQDVAYGHILHAYFQASHAMRHDVVGGSDDGIVAQLPVGGKDAVGACIFGIGALVVELDTEGFLLF